MSKAQAQQRSAAAPRERRARPSPGKTGGAPVHALPEGVVPERELEREAWELSVDADPRVPTRPTDPVKRGVDILFSLIGLVLTTPAWLILPVLIKLEDGGPVFYTQERVGKGGEHFTSLKFRSMRPRKERGGPLRQAECEKDRITKVGAFMRACALDELPQLLNILRGDMSLVGPRALLPEEIENHSEDSEPVRLVELPGYGVRHSIRPGLTGLAQTRIARDVPHEKKFRYDVRYVWNRSAWLDFKLIVQSVVISLMGKWPEIEKKGSSGESVAYHAE